MRSAVLSLFLAVLGACRPAAGGPLPRGAEALVTERQFTVAFPAAPIRADAFPYYDWRFGTRGPGGFTARFSIDADAPAARAAVGSLDALVRGASLRLCELPSGHVLVCARSLEGEGRVAGERVMVVVRDTALVRTLRRERPAYVWRSVFRPDRPFLHDSVRISYEQ